jgi:hypothetical protein
MNEREVRLYADACSERFALKQEGAPWVKEFASLQEAIRYVTALRRADTCSVTVHDFRGFAVTRLTLRGEA